MTIPVTAAVTASADMTATVGRRSACGRRSRLVCGLLVTTPARDARYSLIRCSRMACRRLAGISRSVGTGTRSASAARSSALDDWVVIRLFLSGGGTTGRRYQAFQLLAGPGQPRAHRADWYSECLSRHCVVQSRPYAQFDDFLLSAA